MKDYTYRLSLLGAAPQEFTVEAHDAREAAGYAYSEAIRLGARPAGHGRPTNVLACELVCAQPQ